MSTYEEILETQKIFNKFKTPHIFLHCTSAYPSKNSDKNLRCIIKLRKLLNEDVGFSGHGIGSVGASGAVALGAKLVEKHVTLNRAWKGSDHNFALEPNGFRMFVRDINRVPTMMNEKNNKLLGKESVFKKLGKSIIVNKNLKKGTKLKISDLSGKIFEKEFIPIRETYKFMNKRLKKNLKKDQPITFRDI